MSTREKLSDEAISTFVSGRSGWVTSAKPGEPSAIEKTFTFKEYASGVTFAVRLAFAAEKRDHHPDMLVSWGKVRVTWSTHDAGGVTQVDADMADVTDRIYAGG